jgi:toxin ParE1/3/4
MKYEVLRTDTADAGIRKIILYIAQNFGNAVALEKLEEIEQRILELGDDPYIGTEPRYLVLKRQGYKVLILEKNLVFYKIDEDNKKVIIYAVVDQRQDYLNIIRGL